MRWERMTELLLLFFVALPLCAGKHFHIKDSQQGEYYEYDLVGSHKDQVKREMGYHTKKALKAPFKFVGKCYHTTKGAMKGTLRSIELFLSDSHSINGQRQDFTKAVSEFEVQTAFDYYYVDDFDREDAHCIFGLPTALWKTFKNILYTAGFRFPRATWRTVKGIFHGGCCCVNG